MLHKNKTEWQALCVCVVIKVITCQVVKVPTSRNQGGGTFRAGVGRTGSLFLCFVWPRLASNSLGK